MAKIEYRQSIPTGGKYSVQKMNHSVGYRCSKLITVMVLKSTIQDALAQENNPQLMYLKVH